MDDPGICGICCLAVFLLGLAAGSVAYFVLGIIYLVQDYDSANDCNGSNLWAYVLVSLILFCGRGGAGRGGAIDEKGAGVAICALICLGLIESGLSIWGGIELWVNADGCSDLKDSELWTFGLVSFSLQAASAGICFVIAPIAICCVLSRTKARSPSQGDLPDLESRTDEALQEPAIEGAQGEGGKPAI